MSRRLAERPPRRLLRMRPAADRAEHGQHLALRPEPHTDAAVAQRADQRALRALAEENAMLARELGRVQARCTQWRDDCIAQAERLESLLMRARGDLIAKQTQIAALHEALEALRACGEGHTGQQSCSPAAPLAPRRVLCVGGRARQMPVYRGLVERGGDRFDHIDGADSACLPRLRAALADADLVILQPGYACQGVCNAVEQHCARTAVRCIRLDKACALGFARSLAEATTSSGSAPSHPDYRAGGRTLSAR
jgi:hypothetical protein